MLQDRLLAGAVFIMTAAACITTALVIRREYYHTDVASPGAPVRIKQWREIARAGQRIGPPAAPVTIVEFSDFQCPFCRQFSIMAREARRRYPGQIALVYRNFPLTTTHPLAYNAALAAECAATQGRFEQYHDVVFGRQDSVGILSWNDFAARAGVPDSTGFAACITQRSSERRVQEDIAIGNELHISGTPVIIINDVMLVGVPAPAVLDSFIRRALHQSARAARHEGMQSQAKPPWAEGGAN